MNSEEQALLRYVCNGCENISCCFHIDEYKVIGAPHNCSFGSGPGKWHPQMLVDGVWVDTSEEVLNSMLELLEENP